MKQPARFAKICKWAGLSILIGVPAMGMALAAAHSLLGSPISPRLDKSITQLPTVSFWAGTLPTTKIMGGMPTSLVTAFLLFIATLAALARMNHHRAMLAKENEARELRDL